MPFYKLVNLTSSVRGEHGADSLLERLRNGQLRMDVLPNSYPRFTGQLEEEDYIFYCHYMDSLNGQKLFNRLEKADGKDYVELDKVE